MSMWPIVEQCIAVLLPVLITGLIAMSRTLQSTVKDARAQHDLVVAEAYRRVFLEAMPRPSPLEHHQLSASEHLAMQQDARTAMRQCAPLAPTHSLPRLPLLRVENNEVVWGWSTDDPDRPESDNIIGAG